jgi:hypothetical protein
MKFKLSIEVDDHLLPDLRQYFHIESEIVRQDLQAALARTVEIYERDAVRIKKAKKRKGGGKG